MMAGPAFRKMDQFRIGRFLLMAPQAGAVHGRLISTGQGQVFRGLLGQAHIFPVAFMTCLGAGPCLDCSRTMADLARMIDRLNTGQLLFLGNRRQVSVVVKKIRRFAQVSMAAGTGSGVISRQ